MHWRAFAGAFFLFREKCNSYYGHLNTLKGVEMMIGIAGAVLIAVGALMIAKWIKDE